MNRFGSRYDLLTACIRESESDILGNCSGKHPCLLKHHAETASQAVASDLRSVFARNCDLSAVDIVEPQQEIDYGGLAAACRTDNRHALARSYIKAEILYKLAVGNIRETNVLKGERSCTGINALLMRIVRNFLLVKHVKNSLC